MADIDVVPKQRSLTWMWILAAIVIVALLMWALMGNREPSRSGVVRPSGGVPSAEVASAVQPLSA